MWDPENYATAVFFLTRMFGVIYFFAIGPFLFQIKGLLGKNGILPVGEYLEYFRIYYAEKRFYYLPTVFWFNSSDKALLGVTILGILVSIFLACGYYPAICLGILFILYLSIVAVGQDFLSFGWESLLLEITFYTFFVSLTSTPNFMMWICLNFLLFRFLFLAGAVKLQSRDETWRNFTALKFHYQTQPLPNTWAWYVYRLPLAFHKASTLFMFFSELIAPFGLFLTDTLRAGTGLIFLFLQLIIWLTGNFSFLNHLTAGFSIIAFSNEYLPKIHDSISFSSTSSIDDVLTLLGAVFSILQGIQLWNQLQPKKRLLNLVFERLSFFHLVNRYGLFAIMTTKRSEIVIEGSLDGKNWKEYLCKYKPSEITRRPGRISPYQPRLDWQMWFLPFEHFKNQNWFHRFLFHILKGTPDVLGLLRYNPFPSKAPKYVRALIYDYTFSTHAQKMEKGRWWQRKLIGSYSPVMSLNQLKSQSEYDP